MLLLKYCNETYLTQAPSALAKINANDAYSHKLCGSFSVHLVWYVFQWASIRIVVFFFNTNLLIILFILANCEALPGLKYLNWVAVGIFVIMVV